MIVRIENLRISNFLSFFGEYAVNLTPYTAIMCNFYQGKDDFFRAIEFVFGGNLLDLRVEKPLDLVHKVLREEFLINRNVHSFVEVTLVSVQDNKQLKLSRWIKNGANNSRIEHRVSDLITSSLLYEEKLTSLGVHINQKSLIYYKSYFNNAIWGSAEDLERTICTCLRESYLFEEWKKADAEVKYLTKLKSETAVKDCNSMRKSLSVIAKYTKKFEVFSSYMETAAEEILETFENDSLSDSSSSQRVSSNGEISPEDVEETKKPNLDAIESEIYLLTEKLCDLRLSEAFLTSHLHHKEIKLASKPVNASILQNRITLLKTEIQKKEKKLSEIWEKIQSIKFKLDNVDRKISSVWVSLRDLEIRKFRQNRFTQYGRFDDYVQPSKYVQLLKQIIGVEIFYAHLCDSLDEAFALVKQLKDLKYEHREVFLPLENYSHKLRDIITASGEKGISINTLEELLIFLCKLKHYELIDEVPVIVQRRFNFEGAIPNDYTVYIQNNLHFGDGLISLKTEECGFFLESENELEKIFVQHCTEEEMNYRKWNDLLYLKLETLVDMSSLENDVFYLKQKWKKSSQKPHVVRELSLATEIYEEYSHIFKEYVEERENYEIELQHEEESFLSEKDSSASSIEESLGFIVKDLEEVVTEKMNTRKKLESMKNELHLLNTTPVWGYKLRVNFIIFQKDVNKSKLFFEKEFKKLKKIMKEDDMEDFLGSQDWRKAVIASLVQDNEKIKMKLKNSTLKLQKIATTRKTRLYQLFDHCSRYLTSTFHHILDGALPFIQLNFGTGEKKIHIMSSLEEEKINVVDIKHFNTFLKFISAFSVFIEIAKFDKIPFLVIDDIEEYFPQSNDDLSAIISSNVLDNILPQNQNQRFHLIMRVGQFLQHFIKKNNPGKMIRNNGNNTDFTNGPVQIICFAKEDFVHTAEHFLWIQSQILPDEYMSENCNSYSAIHEINMDHESN